MAQELHSFPFEDALARSNDVFELEFPDWGFRTAAPGVNVPEINLQWPPPGSRPVPSSVAAISIGPRSTIDRCWYTWDRLKVLNIPPADNLDPNAVVSLPRIITREAPLLFAQATQKEPTLSPVQQSWWDAMQFGTSYVFPWGPKPGVNPLTQGVGASGQGGAFGTTTTFFGGQQFTNMFGVNEAFTPTETPFLQLQFHMKLPAFSPPTKRAAMARETTFEIAVSGSFFMMIPIFGRKSVGVSYISHNFSGSAAQITDFRVGLVRNINENPTGAFSPIFEVKAFEQLAVAANAPVNAQLTNPCADYLTVRVTNGVVGPAGGAVTVVAED